MPIPFPFDWKNPDYSTAFKWRLEALGRLRQEVRKDKEALIRVKEFYRDNPAQFIIDWGCTVDPRLVERNLPAVVPFLLFPKQEEWVTWLVEHWKAQKPGLTEKTRDMGMSWLSVSVAATLCLFYNGMAVGFGSRKEEYVDKIGAPKSLFHKARTFVELLPLEFRGGWNSERDAPHMRINFPETGSNISGEAGDNIGRGDRTSIYFVDEAAHLERPQLVEASLSMTTNCRMDISSPNGMANPFASKRFGGRIDVFTFHWRDDPRKGQEWYDKQVSEKDPVTIAQEVDIDYSASVEGIVIPHAWVRAALDAHIALGITPSGERSGALDVADEGKDMNAFCGAHGIMVERIEEWSGKGSDIMGTVHRAFELCDELGYRSFKYDADGLGAGCRGDARTINLGRSGRIITADAFRGSEGVFNPDGEDEPGRKNSDYFANRKAQSWHGLRRRFLTTYRAVAEGKPYKEDDIISISSKAGPHVQKLMTELSQATWAPNNIGKMVVDKAPDGTKSPNLADSVVIRFSKVSSLSTWAKLGRAA